MCEPRSTDAARHDGVAQERATATVSKGANRDFVRLPNILGPHADFKRVDVRPRRRAPWGMARGDASADRATGYPACAWVSPNRSNGGSAKFWWKSVTTSTT